MFELKYMITEADIKAEEKKSSLLYFSVYGSIGLIGLAAGIVAIVLKPSTALFVLGIIMTALASVLFIISVMILLPGKGSLRNPLGIADRDLTVKIGNVGIDVCDVLGDLIVGYTYDKFNGVKLRDKYIALYINAYYALIVKCEDRAELERIYDFLCAKTGKSVKRKQARSTETTKSPEAPEAPEANDAIVEQSETEKSDEE